MFGVMHTEKYGRGAVYGMQIEDRRTEADRGKFERSAIDWNRTKENYHLVDSENWNKRITSRLREEGLKERKNSNVLIGTVYSASPEFFENMTRPQIEKYFQKCLDFHIKEYCQDDKSRIVSAVVHLDETTPHMQIQSIPLFKDEDGMHLSAKLLIGNRNKMREAQNRFHEEVCKEYGLERGELVDWNADPKERKSHKDKVEYWRELEKELSSKVEALTKKTEELERKYHQKLVPDYNKVASLGRKLQSDIENMKTEKGEIKVDISELQKEKLQLETDIEKLANEIIRTSKDPAFKLQRWESYLRKNGGESFLIGFEKEELQRERDVLALLEKTKKSGKSHRRDTDIDR